MKTIVDRKINADVPLIQIKAWEPVATQQTQRLLSVLQRRQVLAREKQLRFSAWLAKLAVRIRPMASFQPLNLQWYRPEWPALSSMPAGKNLWRHEYFVRTVTVHQGSSHSNGLSHSVVMHQGSADSHGLSHHKDGGALDLSYNSEAVRSVLPNSTPTYSPRLQVQSDKTLIQILRTQKWLTGQTKKPALTLAASGQPRKEVLLSQYRTGRTEQSHVSTGAVDKQWPWDHKEEVSRAFLPKPARAAYQPSETPSLVNQLFDRAMQAQPQPGLDLQLLPLRTTKGSISESLVARPPEPATRPLQTEPAHLPPVQFSRNDVNRVADKVAQVLKQREHFERERRGTY